MDKYAELRAALDQTCHALLIDDPDTIRALLAERDSLRAALVAILEHDSPINIVDTATATERDIFDIASTALAQGEA